MATEPLKQLSLNRSEPEPVGAGSPAVKAESPAPEAPPSPPRPFDVSAAALDLTKTDGTACAATSDTGLAGNAAIMLRVGAAFGAAYALNDLSDGKYQAQLNALKPALKDLSRNVLWLPVEAETLLGDTFFRINRYQAAQPPRGATHRRVVEEMRQTFDQMVAYAREELKSPFNFRLTFVAREAEASMHMLPGGHLIVPENVVELVAQERDLVRRTEIIHFMIAHEMSHALRRHSTKMAQVNLVDGILVADRLRQYLRQRGQGVGLVGSGANLGQMLNFSAETIGTMVGSICGTQRWFNQLEENQELEADVCGAKLLHEVSQKRTGRQFDPIRAVEGYESLKSRVVAITPPKGASAVQAGVQQLCFQAPAHPRMEHRHDNLRKYWTTLNPDYRPVVAERDGAHPRGHKHPPARSSQGEARRRAAP